MKRSTTLSALALASGLALAGCGAGGQDTASETTAPATSDATATATTPASPSAAASPTGSAEATGEPVAAQHNDADVMFAQMMIPHHQQAVQMSEIMLAKEGLDPQVRELAEQIEAAQGPEIERMNQMLETWGQEPMTDSGSGGMDHGSMDHGSGSGMSGMLSPEDLDQLEAASGEEAARLFLTGMIDHHRGAVDMAQDEVDSGENPQAVALAQQVIEDQETEITEMETLLQEL